MRVIATILTLFVLTISVKAQTIGAVTEQAVPSAGNMVYFIPSGYSTAAPGQRRVEYVRPGAGATNFANIKNESPFKELDNGTNKGKDLDKNGDTVYTMYLASYVGTDPCSYITLHMSWAIANWPSYVDTVYQYTNKRWTLTGYSQGGQDISKFLTTFCNVSVSYNTDLYRFKFAVIGTAETGQWNSVSDMNNRSGIRYWGWHDNTSPTSTQPWMTEEVYDAMIVGNSGRPYSIKEKYYDVTHLTGDDSFWRQSTAADNANTSFALWAHDTSDLPTPLAKVTGIHNRDIIQLTGAGLTITPFSQFDEQSADPANGVNTPTPTTRSISTNPIHYSSYLNNEWTYAVHLRGSYKMNQIWLYAANSFFDDSVIFYKGDFKTGWTRIAGIRITAGTTGWQQITLPGTDTSRFIRVGHKGTWESAYGINGPADVNEIIFYGDLIGSRLTAPASYPYTGSLRETPLMRNYAGTNQQKGYVNTRFIRKKTSHRQGLQVEWYESAGGLNDYPSNTYDYNVFGQYPSVPAQIEKNVKDSIVNILGQRHFNFLIHSNARYRNQGGPEEGHHLNNFGDNPYDVSKYTRVGNFWWTRFALYGSTTVDTNDIAITGIPKFTALGTDTVFEDDNEVDGFWKSQDTASSATATKLFISPWAYTTKSQMAYDGYEQRYGPRVGAKVADPNAVLLEAGIVGFDSSLTESRRNISRFMRTDSADIYGAGFNFHYYPNDNVSGIHPAKDSSAKKFAAIMDYCYRVNPALPVWITEGGFDAFADSTSASSATGSIYGVDHDDSYSNRQTQALCRLFYVIEASRAKVDHYMNYNFVWNAAENNAGGYQTAQEYSDYDGVAVEKPNITHFVNWQFDSIMANTKYSQTLSYGWETMYNIKFVSATNSDSAIHFVAYPNVTGLTSTTSISVGTGKIVKKIVFNLNNYNPTVTDVTATEYNSGTGQISSTWEGMPVLYSVVNATSSVPGVEIRRNRRVVSN